jgi:hypothetical protein
MNGFGRLRNLGNRIAGGVVRALLTGGGLRGFAKQQPRRLRVVGDRLTGGIGYAGGLLTRQRDFSVAAEAIVRALAERPHCREVPFCRHGKLPTLDIVGFPAVKWQRLVSLLQFSEKLELVGELSLVVKGWGNYFRLGSVAQFDINIGLLEVASVFSEVRSELKSLEAVRFEVPTVASQTRSYQRAIQDAVTGFLPDNLEEWNKRLRQLVAASLRRCFARAAQNAVLWPHGALRGVDAMFSVLPQLHGDCRKGPQAFEFELRCMLSTTTNKLQNPLRPFSAKGTAKRFDRVLEAEAAVFGHTDINAQHLLWGISFRHSADLRKAVGEIRFGLSSPSYPMPSGSPSRPDSKYVGRRPLRTESVRVLGGSIFDVEVDIRKGSPTSRLRLRYCGRCTTSRQTPTGSTC